MKNYQNIIHEEFMQKNTHVITLGIRFTNCEAILSCDGTVILFCGHT
jgi:hypothetical protein